MADLREAVEFAPLHDPEAIEMIRGDDEAVSGCAALCVLRYGVSRDDAGGGDDVSRCRRSFASEGCGGMGFMGCRASRLCGRCGRRWEIEFPRRMVIAHLGSGCSVTACVDGKSVDTTMGLTPTGGVVMGTRPGDLDPGLVFYLLRQMERTVIRWRRC